MDRKPDLTDPRLVPQPAVPSHPPDGRSASPHTQLSNRVRKTPPYHLAITRKTPPPSRYCQRPRQTCHALTNQPIFIPCGRPRCSHECRDQWARKLSACLQRSFRDLGPTHEIRVTVLAVICDRRLSLAVSRFLRRLKYALGRVRSGCEYFVVNEWSEGSRHIHILVRVVADLAREMVRFLWAKTLPGIQFHCHCAVVRSPAAIARYIVKHLKDDSKKELAPLTFKGRIYTYSRNFFTRPVADLWKEQLEEWYPARATLGRYSVT